MADILLVDDSDINIQSMERFLSREGYNVAMATNGKEALRLLDQMHFDLVISDLNMPFINGAELVRYMRSKMLETPVIMVSSVKDEISILECYELGVENFFTKPINMTELAQKVKKLIEG